jgi:arylsulfatase A-like enzyme
MKSNRHAEVDYHPEDTRTFSGPPARGQAKHPNVIVFFTDQLRWDCSSLHGNPLDLMPNFDRMARMGTHVSHSFTCQPVCGPARACLQTGKYATTNGCYRNGIYLPRTEKTLGHYFRTAGYHTGYIGKWHLANEKLGWGGVHPAERGGYQEWLASNVLEASSDAYDFVVFDDKGKRVKLPGYRVDAQTDAAIRFIDRNQDRPFFLFNSYIEPHQQNQRDCFPAPDGYAERYMGRWLPPDLAELGGESHRFIGGYYGMVKRLDEALGRMLDALKSLALLENTIVLFTADHGCHFKTRKGEYKRSCHEASIRVPTAFGGGPFQGGGYVDEMVSLVDLPATLLNAANIAVPRAMQGRSILPLLNGRKTRWPEEAFIQVSETEVGRAIRTQRWKYGVTAPDKDPIKDAAADHYVETYLYDLESDPYELNNLAGRPTLRTVANELKRRLLRRMKEAGEAPATISAKAD